ncbi:MAG: MarR family transcriptional regulator [Nitriliruptorales bacterium]|nr:MarR family transcriptional regulator [Nitriliruptorales bacterium]
MEPTTLSPALDATRLRAWRRFLEAHAALIGVLEHELREQEDLPLAWYDVLVHLAEAPDDRLRMQDLADAVLLSKSGLTRLVDRMEGDGLVERQACKTDRRGTFAVLTPRGRKTLREAAPAHLDGVATHFGEHLSESEAELLAEVLERILGSLDN